MKKITVIGHFGFQGNYLDGQTIKTKILTKELDNQLGEEQVGKIDTHGGKKSLPRLFFQTLSALKKSKNVVMLPAHNGIKFFTPILTVGNKLFKRKIFYVVIGGWLPVYLQDKTKLTKRLKKFDGIFVETNTMKSALEEMGFENIFIMPNCKDLKILTKDELVYANNEPYKLCTFSRVCKEKGIEDALQAVKDINEKAGRTVFALDIYGQIDKNQTEWFENLQSQFPPYVAYLGKVDFDKSVEVLKDYFALLFPTYYEGEGLAGTIIDAFAAGIPVIGSNWRYNSEIIEHGKTGLIFPVREVEVLENILYEIMENPAWIMDMKINCIDKAESFLPSKAIKEFMERLQ